MPRKEETERIAVVVTKRQSRWLKRDPRGKSARLRDALDAAMLAEREARREVKP